MRNQKFYYAFLLGRPGCGKSAIYRRLTEKMKESDTAREFIRIDDFPILQELLDKDVDQKRHIRKDGGFQVTDWTIIDEVLQEMNKKLHTMKKDGLVVFIEFARGDYSAAFKNFDNDLLSEAIIFYIASSFERCLERNQVRFEKLQKDNTLDDHIVPPDLMKTYYKTDDFEELLREGEDKLITMAPTKLVVINNDRDGLEYLDAEIEKVAKILQL